MAIEFWCEGCGSSVVAIGIDKKPGHGFCSCCYWLHDGYKDCNLLEAIRWSNPECFGVTRRADRDALRADFSSRSSLPPG